MKQRGYSRPLEGFLPIHMPKNTWAGIVLAGLSALLGFTLIWQMWLPAAVTFIVLIGVSIYHTFNYQRDYHIPVEDVVRIEGERTRFWKDVIGRLPDPDAPINARSRLVREEDGVDEILEGVDHRLHVIDGLKATDHTLVELTGEPEEGGVILELPEVGPCTPVLPVEIPEFN